MASLWASRSGAAEGPPIPASDHVEAVQARAWIKRGALTIAPVASYAFNDPFLIRGGGGLRAVYWIRSLVGFSLDVSGWAQTPSEDARIAQRELRAQIEPTGSSWAALMGAEIAPVDGKIAVLSSIVPFELFLRLGAGPASSTDAVTSAPALALSAGLGARWYLQGHFGLDTSLTWRSASITRSLNGLPVDARDTVVSFDVGIPFRFGGGP